MKFLFFVLAMIAAAQGGVLPLASYAVAPVATSYSAHTVNHAIATPVAAPVVAAPAPLIAAPAPFVAAAHAPLVAASAPLIAAHSPYAAYPYSAAYLG